MSHLWIVAKKIKALSGARIKYSPIVNNTPGDRGVNGAKGRPDYNPNARQKSSGHHVHHGGNGTSGGRGGNGGKGGKNGYRVQFPCKKEPDRDGNNGRNGERTGHLGSGPDGCAGTLSYEVCTEAESLTKFSRLWIFRIDPHKGTAGIKTVLTGRGFTNSSRILFNNRVQTGKYISGNKMEFNIPQNARGRESYISVRTSDGDVSNQVPFQFI